MKKFSTYCFHLTSIVVLMISGLIAPQQVQAQTPGCIDPSLINPTAICPLIYAPVCGCDGNTYGNSCFAINSGVTTWTNGECPAQCVDVPECVLKDSPPYTTVITNDPFCCNTFWDSACQAAYNALSTSCTGTGSCVNPALINPNAVCTLIYAPVCGCDGITYSNECVAINYGGVTSWTQGECSSVECIDPTQIDPTVLCLDIYLPVCGCDGNTYSNECVATYYGGVTSFTPGPCQTECIDPSQIDPDVLCVAIFSPVCGCDGNTYQNECFATYFGGVTSFTPGPCQTECIDPSQIDVSVLCLDIYLPVCGCDGNTYQNECFATYYGGVTSFTPGPCQTECIDPSQIDVSVLCLDIYLPVCGCDGNTYQNECFATYFGGVTSFTPGPCQTECIDPSQIDPTVLCLDIYLPVCGCDGNTYSNECYATYYGGVTSFTPGPCQTECIDPAQIDLNVLCLDVYIPVCGCDGNTYSNECYATYYGGVTSFTPGPCQTECIDPAQIDLNVLCLDVYIPVCGCDGNTYSNECYATYYGGVTSFTPGPCQPECIDPSQIDPDVLCVAIFSPVCGCDGNTYQNECFATYYGGVTSFTPGPCQPECINPDQIDPNAFCTLQYDPVCGCDGNTYSNDCFAYNNGVTSWTQGECPTNAVLPCTGLTGIDFGPCDAFLGYGLVNGQCVGISGCSPVINGVDYSAALSSELSGCQACPCINPEQIDPNALCTLQYDPVCGCDGNTYSNSCFAYANGVTTWTAGECIPACNVQGGTVTTTDPRLNLCKGDGFPNFIQFTVTGNVGVGVWGIVNQNTLNVVASNTTGLFNIENLPAGQYFAGHISVQNLSQLAGVTNLNQLTGCYSLSNQLAVTSIQLNGGTVSTNLPSPSVCGGNVTATVTGNVGPLSRFILLNFNATQVLAQNTTGVFNFNPLPVGTYRIVHISYTSSVNLQAIVPPTLPPCVASSNQLIIQKVACITAMLESSPNPTTGFAWVTFTVPAESNATLEVYDMSGRKVTELFRQVAQGGETYRVDFDGTGLPNGVYIYRLTTGSEVLVEKFIIAR